MHIRIYRFGLAVALGMLLASCGSQETVGGFWESAKGENGDDALKKATILHLDDKNDPRDMNGEYVEVELGEESTQIEVRLQAAADGSWRCLDRQGLPEPTKTEEGEFQIFTFDLNGWDNDKYAGEEYPLTFQLEGATAAQESEQYFTVTVAVENGEARSDAFIDHACRVIDKALADEPDPDAVALLASFIPHPQMQKMAKDACKELRDKNGGRTPPPNGSGVKPPDRGPFGKYIALTFDDGPSLGSTNEVARILNEEGVPGTFFINGKAVTSDAAWALLKDLITAPANNPNRVIHLLANHTQSHVNAAKYPKTGFGAEQVAPTDKILIEAYGSEENIPRKFFRFPFGSTERKRNDIVQDQPFSYQIVGWHIDTADWCFNSRKGGYGVCDPSTFKWVPDQYRHSYIDYTVYQAKQHGGGILLMHDIHKFTRENLRELIRTLRSEGFKFVRLDDKGIFPKLNDGIGVGGKSGTTYLPPPKPSAFMEYSCKNKLGRDGVDPQGNSWQNYSSHTCVDKYHGDFNNTGCRGKLKAGYCDGAANILCCVKP